MIVTFTISGRYEEEFIDSRMKLLQKWIDRITRHPVLSRSDVFNHFLTCTDEKVSLPLLYEFSTSTFKVPNFLKLNLLTYIFACNIKTVNT